jgi:hypothetical protein
VRNQNKDYAGYPHAHRASLRVSLRRCWLLCVWARHAQTPAASACSWYGRCRRRGAQSVYVGSFRARELRLRASRCNAAPISSDIVGAPLRSARRRAKHSLAKFVSKNISENMTGAFKNLRISRRKSSSSYSSGVLRLAESIYGAPSGANRPRHMFSHSKRA